MAASQTAKTEFLNNVVGFHISHDPAPILVLMPTLNMAETWSKDRLSPMIRDTPILRDKVAEPKSRDSGNTILQKRFRGGQMTIVGANSPSDLASRPIRILAADEIDRYDASAGKEGDPLTLASARTTTFWNKRELYASSPTLKGYSRIEKEWLRSDQRYYFVPCPHCGCEQTLVWAQVKWPEGKPRQAAYTCTKCAKPWSEAQRLEGVSRGRWKPTNAGGEFPGFHISQLYSPWVPVPEVVRKFLAAKSSPEMLKVWVNTVLGEPWEAEAERIDAHAFEKRLEDWGGTRTSAGHVAPVRVILITCGVDIQADRIEIERVGWGLDDESWSLDHHVIYGDPTTPDPWRQLDAYLVQPTVREDGLELPVRTTCIDSGNFTQAVYRFCRPRRHRRVFAIKGRDEATTIWPVDNFKSRAKKTRVKEVNIVGVTVAKDSVYARLRLTDPGPGYCHFPKGRSAGYFEQLTAEVVKTKHTRGFPKRFYELPQGKRNEALDCRVYAYAALISMNIRWGTEALAAAPRRKPGKPEKPTAPLPPPEVAPAIVAQQQVRRVRQVRRSSWMGG